MRSTDAVVKLLQLVHQAVQCASILDELNLEVCRVDYIRDDDAMCALLGDRFQDLAWIECVNNMTLDELSLDPLSILCCIRLNKNKNIQF